MAFHLPNKIVMITDRNQDIDLDSESVPHEFFILEGKQLMLTARFAKISYGVARKRTLCGNSHRHETVGLVIRLTDKKAMHTALEKKSLANKAKKISAPVEKSRQI